MSEPSKVKPDCYDYVRRTYGVPAYVGVRFRATEQLGKGREGVIVSARTDLHYAHIVFDGQRHAVPVHPKDIEYVIEGELYRRETYDALKALVLSAVYVDNGYCSICGGHWPDEHHVGCAGEAALKALGRAV